MSTIKVVLKLNKLNKSGEAPLYLRIIKDRKAKFISLSIYVNPKDWNEDIMRVRKSHVNSQRVNNYIAQKIAEAEGVALEMESDNKFIGSKKIKEVVMGKNSESFVKYTENYIKSLYGNNQINTAIKAETVLRKVTAFNKSKDMTFDDITVNWLKNYDSHHKTVYGNSHNTVHSELKVVRRIINEAIREDIVSPEKNPFLKYKLRWEQTVKEFLTEEELITILNLPLIENSQKWHHRNMFVFAAYAGGLRISDILQLKWQNFDGERINVPKTQKTGDSTTIMLPRNAIELLAKYKVNAPKPSEYIFPYLDSSIDYSKVAKLLRDSINKITAYTNTDLKDIAKMAGIEKSINFHMSRHTFATLALRKGMRIEYVGRLMTHQSIKTTQIYAKIVNEELDKAMMEAFD